jgi:outer membrane protein assembly factor BamB
VVSFGTAWRWRLVLAGTVGVVVSGALVAMTWSGAPPASVPEEASARPVPAVVVVADASVERGTLEAGRTRDAAPPVLDGAGDVDDAGDADAPLVIMQPEVLAAPWDHFGRTARYQGMRDGALVGKTSVLVGCHLVRLLGDGEPHDVPLKVVQPDGGVDRSCLVVVGSDDTRLFFVAGARLHAFDVTAAAVAWSAPIDAEPSGASLVIAAIAGPVVAVASTEGKVLAFDRATGALAWTLAAPVGADPSNRAQTRLAPAGTRIVTMRRAWAPRPGVAGWEVVTREATDHAPETTRGLTNADVVRAVDAASGHVAWTTTLAMADGAPALGADLAANDAQVAVVAVSARSSKAPLEIALLDTATGTARAHTAISSAAPDLHTTFGEELTFTDGGGLYLRRTTRLARVDEASGAIRWEIDDARTRPLVARGAVFVSGDQPVLRALDPATGAAVWSYGFAALRTPRDSPSAALVAPRGLANVVAAFAEASRDGINRSGEVSLFGMVSAPVLRRTASVSASMVDEHGRPDPSLDFGLLGERVAAVGDDHALRVRVRGNGTVAFEAHPNGAGETIPDQVIDLERGKPSYRFVFHSMFFAQGCL